MLWNASAFREACAGMVSERHLIFIRSTRWCLKLRPEVESRQQTCVPALLFPHPRSGFASIETVDMGSMLAEESSFVVTGTFRFSHNGKYSFFLDQHIEPLTL